MSSSRSTILEHVIDPRRGDLPEEVARFFLSLDFPPADPERYAELSAKAQEGTLSEEEQAALDDSLNVNDSLTIIQAKASVQMCRGSAPHADAPQ
jgi:hypothetical protein